jgi:CheY-like chemotaxis protein
MKKKLLLIDQSKLDLFIASKILERSADEFVVSTTQIAFDVLEMIKTDPPDIIVTSLNMPLMSGFELKKQLDRNKIKIPVLLMSSSVNEADTRRARELRFEKYLNKPVTAKYLNNKSLNGAIIKYHENLAADPLVEIIEEQDIGITLLDDKIRLVRLYKDGTYHLLDDADNRYSLLYPFFSHGNDLNEIIEEFEDLINKHDVKEKELQGFFLRHQDFIINEDYRKAHSKLILNDETSDFIPDFVLEPHDQNALCDILELKLPKVKLHTLKKNRLRYSSAVLEACAQLREYAAYFDDPVNRKKFYEAYRLNLYRPRMIVVIGRRKDIEPIQLRRIQSDLPQLQLSTYDDVLDRLKRKN